MIRTQERFHSLRGARSTQLFLRTFEERDRKKHRNKSGNAQRVIYPLGVANRHAFLFALTDCSVNDERWRHFAVATSELKSGETREERHGAFGQTKELLRTPVPRRPIGGFLTALPGTTG